MRKKRFQISYLFAYIILSIWAAIIIGIFVWVIYSSFKDNVAIYQDPWGLPDKITWDNYVSAWKTMKMSTYFMNSIIIVFISLFLNLFISTLTSHALTRYHFAGRGFLSSLLIFSISVPNQLLLIPLYSQLMHLHLINTRVGLILVYTSLWYPFSLF